jgi:DNA-binding transcriptional LysR family regulator
MELRQLHFAVTLAAELHFGRAAEREHITEPALSQQIRHLEQDLGVRLFDRSSRRVQLTQAGVVFLEHAQRVIAAADETVVAVRQAGEGKLGHLRIGFPSTAVPAVVRRIVRTFRSRFPGISYSLTARSDGRLLELLRQDRVDLAILRTRAPTDDDLEFRLICEEPLVVVVPRRHRLARARQIHLASLRDEPLVLFPREQYPAMYDYILRLLSDAGVHVSLIDQYRSLENRYAAARARHAVALVPAATAAQVKGTGLRTRRFADPTPLAQVGVVWRKRDAPSLVKTFIKVTKDVVTTA